jgi:hypothetical protein
LADLLTAKGVRATFKVVGEKARVLEKRGRGDVVEALKRHDIAFHSNFHSVHPTPTEYLAECGLLDGVAEFVRREGPGAADVRRVFGVESLACYGQPGSSWASQAIVALPTIGVTAEEGVPCYVDSGNQIGLGGKPFWYCGALNVFNMRPNETRFDLHTPGALEKGEAEVRGIVERLRGEGGGLVSIFYHPCEWVHKEFWDGVNFRRGANPPRDQWRAPPQRTAAETDAAFERFGKYVDFIKDLEGVKFVTARELPGRYPDRVRSEGATKEDLTELAMRLAAEDSSGVNFQVMDGKAFSGADQFELLTSALLAVVEGREAKFPLKVAGLIGPDGGTPAGMPEGRMTDWPAFETALRDVRDFVQENGRVPARVFIGADAIAPADFLVGVARVWRDYWADGRLPTHHAVRFGRGTEVLPGRYVAKDTPGVFGGWIIHREGFRAPKVLDVARLQAWTLKPALRVGEGGIRLGARR